MSQNGIWKQVVKFVGLSGNGRSLRVQSDKPGMEGFTFNLSTDRPAAQAVLDADLSGYGYGTIEVQGQPTVLPIPDANGAVAYGINAISVQLMTAHEYFTSCGISEVSVEEALADLARNARTEARLVGPAPTVAQPTKVLSGYDRAAQRAGMALLS